MITKFIDYRVNLEKKQTNQAPKRIIFYRDGVSEGQFQQVLEKELPLIRGRSGARPWMRIVCSSGFYQRHAKKWEYPQRSPSSLLENATTFGFSRRPTSQIGAGIAQLAPSWIATWFILRNLTSTCKARVVSLGLLDQHITMCCMTRMGSRECWPPGLIFVSILYRPLASVLTACSP